MMSAIEEAATRLGAAIALQVGAIDSMLHDIDHLLNDFQPALTGKVRILWVFRDGFIRPRPAVYRRSKADGGWKYDQVGGKALANRTKTSRAFHRNRDVVRELLAAVSTLMEMRQVLLESITAARMTGNARLQAIGPKATILRRRLTWIDDHRADWRQFSLQPLSEEYVDLT